MGWFGLDANSVADRTRSSGHVAEIPCVRSSIGRGIFGFILLSIAGFAPWGVFGRWFYRHVGEVVLYAVCALVFVGLSGPLLHRLIIGPGSLSRFYKVFSLSFSAYAVLWICAWMSLRGHVGSLVGLLTGTVAMGWILTRAFDANRSTIKVIGILFVLNSLGYFGGGWLENLVMGMKTIPLIGVEWSRSTRSMAAHLLWGICYGTGFGAGLGYAFHLCQQNTRAALKQIRHESN